MRSREFIKEAGKAGLRRIIIQKYNDAKEGLVYILKGPNGEVTNSAGQTLTYPTRDAAATARDKMADPSAVQGALDAEKKAPNAMAAGEAGKLGSGTFFYIPKKDPSTNILTQKIKIKEKDADGKVSEKIITKTYKGWADWRKQTDFFPVASWRPGYTMQLTKMLTAKGLLTGYFFTVADIALIASIIWEWSLALDSIRESYKRNDYFIITPGSGREQAELEMYAVNKEYITKLLKAVGTIMAANTGSFLLKKLGGNKTAGTVLANELVSLFKLGGKTVTPNVIQTLTKGGLEAAKIFAANYASNTEFKANMDNALVRWILEYTDMLTIIPASVLQLLVFDNLDLSVGTLSPADDAAMRKNAALNKEPETTGAAPAGTPPKGPIDRAIDKFKAP
jgi:hypothetical protein